MEQDLYWQAVQAHDPAYDGKFVYAVRSTGIYCRPSCPSRRPRPENVLFFSTPVEAEQAGFRPCRRCHPQNSNAANQDHLALAQEICRYLEDHLEEKITLDALSEQFHLSPFHLQRTFKNMTGVTPRQYAGTLRAQRLKTGLRQQRTVTEALYQAGYGSSSSLYESASAHLGMTPAAYQKGGKSVEIEYTIVPCAYGYLLMAATQRGVCAVSLGDSPAEVENLLAYEYPQAVRCRHDNAMAERVQPILQYLEGGRPPLDLPLDIQATAFQWKVWNTLQSIPYGETRTYAQVAAQIGRPTAARAVAHACASNHAALLIPCHRVVGAGGKLSGYKWGLRRKEKLLEMEKGI